MPTKTTTRQAIADIPDVTIKRFVKHASGLKRVTDGRIDSVRKLMVDLLDKWVDMIVIVTGHANRNTVKFDDVAYVFETLKVELQRKGLDYASRLLARCSATAQQPTMPCGFLPKTKVHEAIRAAAQPGFRWSPAALELLHYNVERYVAATLSKK